MPKKLGRAVLAFLPAGLYYGLVFYYSSGNFRIPIEAENADKGLHLAEFAVLGALLAFGWFRASKASFRLKIMIVLASGLVLGSLDEVHQMFVPGRHPDPLDALADTLGVALGLLIYAFWHRRKIKARNSEAPGAVRPR